MTHKASPHNPLPPSSTILGDITIVLEELFPGREEQVEAITLGLATGLPVFLMSPPGTAKTKMIDTLSNLISNANYFYYLLTRYTEPDELIGPLDIKALREGKYERITTRRLPEAHIVMLDEIFKASSAIRNTLLDIILNKRIINGSDMIRVPLKALYTASNEVPQDEEDAAIYDRLVIRSFFEYVDDAVLDDIIIKGIVITAKPLSTLIKKPILSIEDVEKIQEDVMKLAIKIAKDVNIRSNVVKAVRALRAAGFQYSDRRVIQTFVVIAGLALIRGKRMPDITEIADSLVFMAPMTPEHKADITNILEKVGLYGNPEIIERIEHLVKQAEMLIEQYKKTSSIPVFKTLADVVREIDKNMKVTGGRVPRSLQEKVKNVVNEWVAIQEELQSLIS